MKVIHWNTSRENSPMSGIKKYEDELFKNMVKIISERKLNISIHRIFRSKNIIFGSTVFSWFLKYKKDYADIVHASSQVVAPAAYFNKPKHFVVTVHDLAPIRYPFEIRDISEKLQLMFIPKILKKEYVNIIAISQFTKRELMELLGIEEDRITVVYQGVNHSLYRPMDKNICKRFFGLKEEKKYILYVASNIYHKRCDLAKAIFNELLKCRDDDKLIKAGYSEELKGDNIISLGWIREEDMPKLYNSADVYIHTSEYEGFGLPILEAMACGLPVVASNKSAISEVVGNAGYLVDLDENCVEEFAEKVLKCLDREKVNKKGIERAREFSWERTAKETLKVYLKLI